MLSSSEKQSWHTVEGFGIIFFVFDLELSQIKKLCVCGGERERGGIPA
jgi:hypothetical protein